MKYQECPKILMSLGPLRVLRYSPTPYENTLARNPPSAKNILNGELFLFPHTEYPGSALIRRLYFGCLDF